MECFNCTLREAILQYMTDHQMLRYIDALPNFLYGTMTDLTLLFSPVLLWILMKETSMEFMSFSMGNTFDTSPTNINIKSVTMSK